MHWSETLLWYKKNKVGEKIFNEKTGRELKSLVGQCSLPSCKRKKSMIVSDNTIEAEGLGDFFKNLGEKGLNLSKKTAKNVSRNPGRALGTGAKIDTALAFPNSKAALLSLPEVVNFYHTRKGLYLGKLV